MNIELEMKESFGRIDLIINEACDKLDELKKQFMPKKAEINPANKTLNNYNDSLRNAYPESLVAMASGMQNAYGKDSNAMLQGQQAIEFPGYQTNHKR